MHPRAPVRGLALVVASALTWACAEDPQDPLDPEVLRPLTTARGEGQGSDYTGSWAFEFSDETCDCPALELDGQSVELCSLIGFGALDGSISAGSGLLALEFPAAPFGPYSGAIEADGSFVLAGIHDATTLLGQAEGLGRLDGAFSNPDRAAGTIAQRILGELAGRTIDCRWTASFVSQRQ